MERTEDADSIVGEPGETLGWASFEKEVSCV